MLERVRHDRAAGVGSRRGAASLLAGVVMLVLPGCSGAGSPRPVARSPMPDSTASSAPTTWSASPPTTAGPAWPAKPLPVTGDVELLAPTGESVYGFRVLQDTTSTMGVIRYDVSDGDLEETGPTIPGAGALTVTGGWVWVTSYSPTTSSVVLWKISPTSLAVVSEVMLPYRNAPGAELNDATPMAATVGGGTLWVGGGESLYAIDPHTGAADGTTDVGRDIDSLSTAPDGSLLFAAEHSSSAPLVVVDYNTEASRQIAATVESGAIGSGAVLAGPGDVWVTFRTGMEAVADRLVGWRMNEGRPPVGERWWEYSQTQYLGLSISGGVLWVSSFTPSWPVLIRPPARSGPPSPSAGSVGSMSGGPSTATTRRL